MSAASLTIGSPCAATIWSPSLTSPSMPLHFSVPAVMPTCSMISSSRRTWSRVSSRCVSNAFRSSSLEAPCALFGSASTSWDSALRRSWSSWVKTSLMEPSCMASPLSSSFLAWAFGIRLRERETVLRRARLPAMEAAQVSLLRWLRRQLRQPTPLREHLEAAVENDDVAEARRLLAGFEFSDDQRRNVEQLLDAWERGT